jgi:hypothetical protein
LLFLVSVNKHSYVLLDGYFLVFFGFFFLLVHARM